MIITIAIMLILLIPAFYLRIQYTKDKYYTNTTCRYKIILTTNEFLRKNLKKIQNERPYIQKQMLRKEIITYIEKNCDKRVMLYYRNYKTNMNKVIEKLIIRAIDTSK